MASAPTSETAPDPQQAYEIGVTFGNNIAIVIILTAFLLAVIPTLLGMSASKKRRWPPGD